MPAIHTKHQINVIIVLSFAFLLFFLQRQKHVHKVFWGNKMLVKSCLLLVYIHLLFHARKFSCLLISVFLLSDKISVLKALRVKVYKNRFIKGTN